MLNYRNPDVLVGNEGKAKGALGGLLVDDADIDGKQPIVAFDKFLRLAYKYNMLVMIDLHSFLVENYRLNRNNDHPSNTNFELVVPPDKATDKAYLDIFGNVPDFSLATFTQLWQDFAKEMLPYPHVFGADLKNEPHGNVKWVDWSAAATKIGNAIHEVNPHMFIVVEGCDENVANTSPGPCWGASLAGVKTHPVTLTIPNKVIYSPHQYGKGVVNVDSTEEGSWEPNWGWLKKEGFCLMMGEWSMSKKSPDFDIEFNTRLVEYMDRIDVESYFFALNNSSADTVGMIGTASENYEPQLYLGGKMVVADEKNPVPAGITSPETDPKVADILKNTWVKRTPTPLKFPGNP
jgi:hypothetical protein